ncbi:hypothetical protein DPMN_183992 [Dreissena polymorpha]|uniref:Uncharacterized protein n=1 Tax=Dreissena polymorpha TaxID=45954 RepID=A0A9D4DKX2_DREPO|nr:hypothetical protein DPMN_183992 [Dreissena polymorpha]
MSKQSADIVLSSFHWLAGLERSRDSKQGWTPLLVVPCSNEDPAPVLRICYKLTGADNCNRLSERADTSLI